MDSSDKNGRSMIMLLSAMAEMERENIIEQTNNGKKYNALSGNWNGGKSPYGYILEDGKLVIKKEEAEIVKKIFDGFIEDESLGYSGLTGKLNKERIPPRKELINKIILKRKEFELLLNKKCQELQAIEQEMLNAESIKYIIDHFDQAYAKASKSEQKQLLRSLIKGV